MTSSQRMIRRRVGRERSCDLCCSLQLSYCRSRPDSNRQPADPMDSAPAVGSDFNKGTRRSVGQRSRPDGTFKADGTGIEPAQPFGLIPWTPCRQSSVYVVPVKVLSEMLIPPQCRSTGGIRNHTPHMRHRFPCCVCHGLQPSVGTCLKTTDEVMNQSRYGALPLSYGATCYRMAPTGFEPATSGVCNACTPISAVGHTSAFRRKASVGDGDEGLVRVTDTELSTIALDRRAGVEPATSPCGVL